MANFKSILIFQPAALTDVVMATPVSKVLRHAFPQAKITIWTDRDIVDMLCDFCPSIDQALAYNYDAKTSEHQKIVDSVKPDLFVDLTMSAESKALTRFTGAKLLTYKKTAGMHQVLSFLNVLKPINPPFPEKLFPTIIAEPAASELKETLLATYGMSGKQLILVAPAVNKRYVFRSWIDEGWGYLVEQIISNLADTHVAVVVGPKESQPIGAAIAEDFPGKCIDLCGRTTLSDMAALVSAAKAVVACDAFAAHLSAAIGTPVIGLYGPTSLQERGPFGFEDLAVDKHASCQCEGLPHCKLAAATDSGKCMGAILLTEVTEKLLGVIEPGRRMASPLQ